MMNLIRSSYESEVISLLIIVYLNEGSRIYVMANASLRGLYIQPITLKTSNT